jgi:hypothetical protein
MKIPVLRTAMWALSNLCFGKLPAEVQVGFCYCYLCSFFSFNLSRKSLLIIRFDWALQVKPILEIISQLIYSADEKILADACWTVYYICGGKGDAVQDVLDAGVCPQHVNLLM